MSCFATSDVRQLGFQGVHWQKRGEVEVPLVDAFPWLISRPSPQENPEFLFESRHHDSVVDMGGAHQEPPQILLHVQGSR